MYFEDIRIVGVDEQATMRAETGGQMFNVVLKLSGYAPWEWSEYFDARWKSELYMMKRHACASNGFITITCVPTELETEHLSHLQAVVDETNTVYRTHLAKTKLKDDIKKKQDDDDKAFIGELSAKLFK